MIGQFSYLSKEPVKVSFGIEPSNKLDSIDPCGLLTGIRLVLVDVELRLIAFIADRVVELAAVVVSGIDKLDRMYAELLQDEITPVILTNELSREQVLLPVQQLIAI